MTVQLLFKQLTKNIPTEKFWLGFVVRYWKTENSESIPCCEAIEITSLGLTLASENRERNGFSFPMPLWHRNRYPGPDTDTIIPRFYVGINDPDLIFPNYRIFDSVDFIFAAKEGKTLKELGGLTSVTAFSSKQPDGVCMDLFDSHYSAKAVKLPLIELNRTKRREFLRIEKLIEIDSYHSVLD